MQLARIPASDSKSMYACATEIALGLLLVMPALIGGLLHERIH